MDTYYKIAMLNNLHMGSYWRPWNMEDLGLEWLIIERFGKFGEHLLCSDAGQDAGQSRTAMFDNNNELKLDIPKAAPDNIKPKNTCYAILIEENSIEKRATFALGRKLPDGVKVEGQFFAATGLLQIIEKNNKLYLYSTGRNVLPSGNFDAQIIESGFIEGLAWSHEAVKSPWCGEVSTTHQHNC
jgi:hypothetical protein